jgi:hypothetical protein
MSVTFFGGRSVLMSGSITGSVPVTCETLIHGIS